MAKQEKTAAELYREERKARIAKAAKQNSKKSHNMNVSGKATKVITALIALVVVAAIAFSVVTSTGVLERGKVAINIGENEVTLGEYGYYYNAAFSEVFNQAYEVESQYQGYGAMFTGYDVYKMPDEQSYTGEIEGVENPTWADYFEYIAQQQLKYKYIALDYAKENNIVLDEEDLAEVEKTIGTWESQAASENYSLSKYLQANFGDAMSAGLFKQIMQDQSLVQKVEQTKTEELKAAYTDEKVLETYNKDLSAYGTVSFRSYTVNAETVTSTDAEGNESSAVTADTMKAAKAEAEAFAEKAEDEESFRQAASDAEKANENKDYAKYLTDDALTLSLDTKAASVQTMDEKAIEWLFSADSKEGETFIAEEKDTGYTVFYMVEPVHKAPDTGTYDVRHILIKFNETDEEKTETDAEEEPEAKTINAADYEGVVIVNDVKEEITDVKAYNEAIDVLTEYLEGDKSEDSFGELAKKYTADRNGAQGGIYENVAIGDMVPEFENWACDKARKYGDVGIVETTYGYHIMYFIGFNTITWSDEIKNALASEEMVTFREELNAKEGYDITVADAEVVASARKNTMDTAKRYIDSLMPYANYF